MDAAFEKWDGGVFFSAFFSSVPPHLVIFYKNGRAHPRFLEKNEKNRFLI